MPTPARSSYFDRGHNPREYPTIMVYVRTRRLRNGRHKQAIAGKEPLNVNQRIMKGQAVYDADGNELGTVTEVRGAYFKVDAPMQPDYWLRSDALSTTAKDEGLTVIADAQRYDNADTETGTDTRAGHGATMGATTAAYTESSDRLRFGDIDAAGTSRMGDGEVVGERKNPNAPRTPAYEHERTHRE